MEQSLEQQIKQRLVETLELGIGPDKIDDLLPLFGAGLGLDSVDALEVSAMLSLHFNVEIADREAAKEILANVGAIARFIRQQQQQPPLAH
ncbi:MAG TPA: phosphopantetheine-binding protein [Myxococcales bacterium]|jgi:acyl carrier protein